MNRGAETLDFRVLTFERLAATRQLALTEAIIDAVGRDLAPPTFRIYGWQGDSMILGVGQQSSEIDSAACSRYQTALLRRISGGTAVLHDEKTISFQLTLPARHPFISDDIHVNYQRIADLVVCVLAKLNIAARVTPLAESRADHPPDGLEAVCFSALAPYEITAHGRKLVGLAQVRRRATTALQGMVYTSFDPAKTIRLLPAGLRSPQELESALAARATDLSAAAGTVVTVESFVAAFLDVAGPIFGHWTLHEAITPSEAALSESIERTKYANNDWTFRR
jgi:lipoate-protein ligase A